MSFLDNNPFNRPTPNFTSNANTNTFYSNYDYINVSSLPRTSNLTYQSKNTDEFFPSNFQNQTQQFKYSRAAQDNPFTMGTSPFAASNAGKSYQRQNYGSLGSSNNYYSSNASYNTPYNTYDSQNLKYEPNSSNSAYNRRHEQQYNYQSKLTVNNVSSASKYQQPYFKPDKYDSPFRKSNFEKQIDIQIGKARQNQVDTKYKMRNQQTQIANILNKNPFSKGSLKSVDNRDSSSTDWNKKYDYGTYKKQNKYEDLQYKPSYLTTSNVSSIPGFGPFRNTQRNFDQNNENNEKESHKYLNVFEKFEKSSEMDTFINKFDEIVSSSDRTASDKNYNRRANYPQMISQSDSQIPIKQKQMLPSNLQNPFSRNSNFFSKNQDSLNKKNGKNFQQNIEKSLQAQEIINLKPQFQKKYEQYIFKRNSNDENRSIRSKKSCEDKVNQQFQIWQRESLKDKADKNFQNDAYDAQLNMNVWDKQLNTKNNYFHFQNLNAQSSLKSKGGVEKKINNIDDNQNNQIQQKYPGMRNSLDFKQKTKKSQIGKKTSNIKPFSQNQINQFQKYSYSNQNEEQNKNYCVDNGLKDKKNSISFRFSEQKPSNFKQEYNIYQADEIPANGNMRKANFLNSSQQIFSQPNFSKRQSLASLTQNNTEQKIDQKVSKYRYNYDKKQAQTGNQFVQPLKMHDFIDIDLQEDLDYEESIDLKVDSHRNNDKNLNYPNKYHNQHLTQAQSNRTNLRKRFQKDFRNEAQNESNQVHPNFNSVKNEGHHQKQLSNESNEFRNKQDCQFKEKAKQSYQYKGRANYQFKAEENYQFKDLNQLSKQYNFINMKQSGFDFQSDQFQETERKLGLKQEQNQYVNGKDNKILIPENGYLQVETAVHKNIEKINQDLSKLNENLAKDYNSKNKATPNYIQNCEDEEFLPSFNTKNREQQFPNSNTKQYLTKFEESEHSLINSLTNRAITGQSKKQNIQQKVQRMKIYDSESEEFRSSGEYQKQANKNKMLYQKRNAKYSSQEQSEVYQKSPFQRKKQAAKKQTNEKQKIRDLASNDPRYKNLRKQYFSQNLEVDKFSLGNQKAQKQKQLKKQSNKQDLQESDLQQTKKYSKYDKIEQKKYNNISRQFVNSYMENSYMENSHMEQPVRDSFEFEAPQEHRRSDENKKGTPKFYKKNNIYPQTLQLKGNIYQLIQFV